MLVYAAVVVENTAVGDNVVVDTVVDIEDTVVVEPYEVDVVVGGGGFPAD